jgi:hypothetical protein
VLLMLRRREQARGGLVTAIEVGSYLSS